MTSLSVVSHEDYNKRMGEKGIIKDGLHYLGGFDYHTFNQYDYEDWPGEMIEGYVIVLDGKKYLIYTDPDDGYRSYNVVRENDSLRVGNVFAPEKVIIYTEDIQSDYSKEIYESRWVTKVINEKTKKLILEFGTDNYDDYYPRGFVHWYPENLDVNNHE